MKITNTIQKTCKRQKSIKKKNKIKKTVFYISNHIVCRLFTKLAAGVGTGFVAVCACAAQLVALSCAQLVVCSLHVPVGASTRG